MLQVKEFNSSYQCSLPLSSPNSCSLETVVGQFSLPTFNEAHCETAAIGLKQSSVKSTGIFPSTSRDIGFQGVLGLVQFTRYSLTSIFFQRYSCFFFSSATKMQPLNLYISWVKTVTNVASGTAWAAWKFLCQIDPWFSIGIGLPECILAHCGNTDSKVKTELNFELKAGIQPLCYVWEKQYFFPKIIAVTLGTQN